MNSSLLSRRRLLGAAAAGALALSACGSDGGDSTADGPDDPTLPPATDAPESTVVDPGGEPGDDDRDDEAPLVEVGFYGGFSPFEMSFQSAPAMMVTATGELIRPAPVPAIFPGPLLPQHTVAPVSDDGIETLMAYLEDAGMFADIDYEADSFIADASTTTLVITVEGETYRHEAYALGLNGGLGEDATETPERIQLSAVVAALLDPVALIGEDEIGEEEQWVPEAYQLVVVPVADLSGYEMPPTVVEWPTSTGIVLADTSECVEADRESVGDLLEGADQLTFFSEGGSTYQVVARPAYPGRDCPS